MAGRREKKPSGSGHSAGPHHPRKKKKGLTALKEKSQSGCVPEHEDPDIPSVEVLPNLESGKSDVLDEEAEERDLLELVEHEAPEIEGPLEIDTPLTAFLDEDAEHISRACEALTVVSPDEEKALVRHDPLRAYIHEVRKYPLLSREEEHELAIRYAETKDLEAARRLVTSNLRLVVKIAHEYQRAYRNLLDLIQEGNIGLMQAVRKYDPYRGVKFSSYAAWWIRAYVLKFILNNWRLVKIGTTQAQRKLFFNLRKEKERLELLGIEVEPKLLAERLDVSEQEVREMEQRLESPEMSLDAPLRAEETEKRTFLDIVAGTERTRPDMQVESDEFGRLLREKLETFGATLEGREATLFHDRLLKDPPCTLQEIGDRYGISRERARQLEERLLEKLRAYLRRELGDTVKVMLGREE